MADCCSTNPMLAGIEKWVDDNEGLMKELALTLWQYAELGLVEKESSRLLADVCKQHGFTVEMGIAGMPTAFMARWGEGKPAIGFLAEYDALPGLSQKAGSDQKEPFEDGAPGHGCGHNLLGVGGLGAALALKSVMEENNLAGSVYLFGCPAEETINAKGFIVRDGYLDDVDAVIDWHPSYLNSVNMKSSLACDSIKYHFKGRASHAAGDPEYGRSALDAVELMNVSVNYLREHVPTSTRIHYVITHGGQEPNVVPASATVWYYLRAPLRSQVVDLIRRVGLCAQGAAMMTETEVDIQVQPGGYVDGMSVSKAVSRVVDEELKAVGPPKFTEEMEDLAARLQATVTPDHIRASLKECGLPSDYDSPMHKHVKEPEGEGLVSPGSTDVGDVSWKVPTAHLGMACQPLGTPGHSWQAVSSSGSDLGLQGMLAASKVMGRAGWRLINGPEILAEAKREHDRKVEEEGYESGLSPDAVPPLGQWDH